MNPVEERQPLGGADEGSTEILAKSLSDPEVMFNPGPYYRALREAAPVHYDERMDLYLVSRFEDLQEVLYLVGPGVQGGADRDPRA